MSGFNANLRGAFKGKPKNFAANLNAMNGKKATDSEIVDPPIVALYDLFVKMIEKGPRNDKNFYEAMEYYITEKIELLRVVDGDERVPKELQKIITEIISTFGDNKNLIKTLKGSVSGLLTQKGGKYKTQKNYKFSALKLLSQRYRQKGGGLLQAILGAISVLALPTTIGVISAGVGQQFSTQTVSMASVVTANVAHAAANAASVVSYGFIPPPQPNLNCVPVSLEPKIVDAIANPPITGVDVDQAALNAYFTEQTNLATNYNEAVTTATNNIESLTDALLTYTGTLDDTFGNSLKGTLADLTPKFNAAKEANAACTKRTAHDVIPTSRTCAEPIRVLENLSFSKTSVEKAITSISLGTIPKNPKDTGFNGAILNLVEAALKQVDNPAITDEVLSVVNRARTDLTIKPDSRLYSGEGYYSQVLPMLGRMYPNPPKPEPKMDNVERVVRMSQELVSKLMETTASLARQDGLSFQAEFSRGASLSDAVEKLMEGKSESLKIILGLINSDKSTAPETTTKPGQLIKSDYDLMNEYVAAAFLQLTIPTEYTPAYYMGLVESFTGARLSQGSSTPTGKLQLHGLTSPLSIKAKYTGLKWAKDNYIDYLGAAVAAAGSIGVYILALLAYQSVYYSVKALREAPRIALLGLQAISSGWRLVIGSRERTGSILDAIRGEAVAGIQNGRDGALAFAAAAVALEQTVTRGQVRELSNLIQQFPQMVGRGANVPAPVPLLAAGPAAGSVAQPPAPGAAAQPVAQPPAPGAAQPVAQPAAAVVANPGGGARKAASRRRGRGARNKKYLSRTKYTTHKKNKK